MTDEREKGLFKMKDPIPMGPNLKENDLKKLVLVGNI